MFPRRLAPILLAPFILAGCAHAPAPSNGLKQKGIGRAQYKQDPDVPIFPADDLGRRVALRGPAQRVVVIGPGAVETMFDLGAASQLVGRDSYADFPASAKKVAVGGDYNGPNVEQCLALRPDLVVVQGETSNRARFEGWQSKIGVPVAALTTTNFASLAGDFTKLGGWINKPKEAAALAKQFTLPLPPVKATALIQTGDTPDWIAGRGTLVADAARHAGYANIADALRIDGYKKVNVESLLVHQPDAIIVPSKKPRAQILASLRADAGFSKLACVRAGRVIVVDGDLLLRPGPRLLDGVAALKRAKLGD